MNALLIGANPRNWQAGYRANLLSEVLLSHPQTNWREFHPTLPESTAQNEVLALYGETK